VLISPKYEKICLYVFLKKKKKKLSFSSPLFPKKNFEILFLKKDFSSVGRVKLSKSLFKNEEFSKLKKN